MAAVHWVSRDEWTRKYDNREDYREKNDKTVIAFFPNKHERKREEANEIIEMIITLKKYGFHLIVLSDGDGYAVFENNELVMDGGLAKLILKYKPNVWQRREILGLQQPLDRR